MTFTRIWRAVHLGGLLSAICLCSCATGLGGSRLPAESLAIPFLFQGDKLVWEMGHNSGDQVQRVTEFVRPGQSVENWTELLTAQTLNKAFDVGSVENQFAAYKGDIAMRCPGSTAEIIRELSDGILYEAHIVNCEQGSDEHTLARVLDGTSNRFIVQYAMREAAAMTPERRAEWIEKLISVQIMSLQ
jgi:hypothetical protein